MSTGSLPVLMRAEAGACLQNISSALWLGLTYVKFDASRGLEMNSRLRLSVFPQLLVPKFRNFGTNWLREYRSEPHLVRDIHRPQDFVRIEWRRMRLKSDAARGEIAPCSFGRNWAFINRNLAAPAKAPTLEHTAFTPAALCDYVYDPIGDHAWQLGSVMHP